MIFTREELDNYNIDQLRNLATYFALKFSVRTSKGRLREKIYTHLEKLDIEVDNLPAASVRVRRIRESQKEK